MADEATFEFNSDEELRALNEYLARQEKALKVAGDSLQKQGKQLSANEMFLRQVQVERVKFAQRLLGKKARGFVEQEHAMRNPSGMGGSENMGLRVGPMDPAMQRQVERYSHLNELTGIHEQELQENERFKNSGGGSRRTGKDLESDAQSFSRALRGAGAAAGAIAAALQTAGGVISGAANIRNNATITVGEQDKIIQRFAMEMRMDPEQIKNSLAGTGDVQGGLQWMQQRILDSYRGRKINTAQFNSAMGAASRGVSWSDINVMSGDYRYQQWDARGDFPSGTDAYDYQHLKRRASAAEFDALRSGDQTASERKKRADAMFLDAAWNAFSVQHPEAASLPGAREAFLTSPRHMGDAARWNEATQLPPEYQLPTMNLNPAHSPVAQPVFDVTSGGRGMNPMTAAQAAAKAAATAVTNNRRPDPRSGVRPGE